MPINQQLAPYGSILLVMVLAMAIATGALLVAHLIGPSRRGSVKDDSYESGMPVIGDARRRFNVRFYIVAMLFLLFDVELVFLWPWAPVFHEAATAGTVLSLGSEGVADKGFLLLEMVMFLGILLVGYVYAWGKGVFQWD